MALFYAIQAEQAPCFRGYSLEWKLTGLLVGPRAGTTTTEDVPESIWRDVYQSNVNFMHQRDLYSPAYFNFLNTLIVQHSCGGEAAVAVGQVACSFFFNTYATVTSQPVWVLG